MTHKNPTDYEHRQAALEAKLGMNPCEMYGFLFRAGVQFDWNTQTFRQRGGAVIPGDFLDVVEHLMKEVDNGKKV